ncbi:MAG: hypothetical protein AAGC67_14025 [Myxococcota bacterium]
MSRAARFTLLAVLLGHLACAGLPSHVDPDLRTAEAADARDARPTIRQDWRHHPSGSDTRIASRLRARLEPTPSLQLYVQIAGDEPLETLSARTEAGTPITVQPIHAEALDCHGLLFRRCRYRTDVALELDLEELRAYEDDLDAGSVHWVLVDGERDRDVVIEIAREDVRTFVARVDALAASPQAIAAH